MTARILQRLIPSVAASDGAGVKIKRSLGQNPHTRLDPFLMLDFFGSATPGDYIKGFPPHPHRGFETVTYMLDGHMLHQDHLGNQGHLKSGGVQWMTAGRGIIHSEMPQQESGLMRGFQLWLNLPAAEKMQDPAYLDLDPAQIPLAVIPQGLIKVIAGTLQSPADAKSPILPETTGPIRAASTQPLYLDLQLHSAADLTLAVPAGHNALIYPYEGEAWLDTHRVPLHHAGVLSDGDSVQLRTEGPARIIVLAGKPLQEPVVQYGPFVMNTQAQINQAMTDYQAGKFGQI